jgi:hypothetical protein
MIFKFWKDIMGFAFAPLYISGGAIKTAASFALPAIGFSVGGPLGSAAIGAAAGGALAGMATGGGIKGALTGAALGFGGAKLGAFGGIGGGLSSIGQSVKGGLSNIASFFGGPQAFGAASNVTGGAFVQSLGGMAPRGTFNAASSAMQGIGQQAVRGISAPQFLASPQASMSSTAAKALLDTTTSVGGDAEAIYQKYLQSKLPGSKAITETVTAPNLATGLQYNRAGLGDFLVAASGQYQDELAAQQLDALREASGQYRDEFAGHYSQVAKDQLAALDRGELPEQYLSALQRTADEVSRRLISQGHNPAESGYGREVLERTLVDQEAKFFANERSYATALAGGAAGMNQQMLALEGQLSQAQRADLGAARTQTVKSLLNLGGIGTTPTQPSLNIKLT